MSSVFVCASLVLVISTFIMSLGCSSTDSCCSFLWPVWLGCCFPLGGYGGALFLLLMIRLYVLRTVLLFYLAVIGLSLSEMNVNLAAWLARVSSTHPRDSRKLNLSFGDAQMPRIWREGNGLKLGMGSISSRLILIFGAQTLGAFNRALNPKPSGLNPCPKPFP